MTERTVNAFPSVGVYAITDATLCARHGIEVAVRAALEGGAAVVQYRDKSDDASRRLDEAGTLAHLCHAFGVPLIVNDDVDLAIAAGAHGVHVGRDDAGVAEARARLPGLHIGASCYADLERMRAALSAGADHVAFGAAFVSTTKPGASPLPPVVLARAARQSPVPVVAIGGIDARNAHRVCATGVRLLAVVSSVFGAADITLAVRELAHIAGTAPGPNGYS